MAQARETASQRTRHRRRGRGRRRGRTSSPCSTKNEETTSEFPAKGRFEEGTPPRYPHAHMTRSAPGRRGNPTPIVLPHSRPISPHFSQRFPMAPRLTRRILEYSPAFRESPRIHGNPHHTICFCTDADPTAAPEAKPKETIRKQANEPEAPRKGSRIRPHHAAGRPRRTREQTFGEPGEPVEHAHSS